MGCAGAASATTITQTNSIPSTDTDWTSSLTFAKFNSGLGTLNSISFTLSGTADGDLQVENRSRSASTIVSTLKAVLTLTRPDLSTLVNIIPLGSFSDSLTAYDGTQDFGGTSGRSHLNLTFAASNSFLTSSASDIALFSGAGSIFLPISADGTTTFSASGNVATFADEFADATVTVVYDYTARKVPEPLTLSLFGAGIAGVAVARRRKKSA